MKKWLRLFRRSRLVYVLSAADYGDYEVLGVFSGVEAAKAAAPDALNSREWITPDWIQPPPERLVVCSRPPYGTGKNCWIEAFEVW